MTDDITRVPLLWKPAANANVPASVVDSPVGLLDLAPTWMDIAGLVVPNWMDGSPLPKDQKEADDQGREAVFCQYEGYTPDYGIVMDGVFADNKMCVYYPASPTYEGTEGELYHMDMDPTQRVNFWDDPLYAGVKKDSLDLIRTRLYRIPQRHPLPEPGALI